MLILASSSEWRAKLLAEAGIPFHIVPTDLDESPYQQSIHDPERLVLTLAQAKADLCYQQTQTQEPILAADTIVWANNQIIGKPADRQDAKRIISILTGTTHEVWTGVCLQQNRQNLHLYAEKTEVTFRQLTDQDIEAYLNTNDWVGKAGAYQLQRNIGKYVTSIKGDPNNIIGLPTSAIKMCKTLCFLKAK